MNTDADEKPLSARFRKGREYVGWVLGIILLAAGIASFIDRKVRNDIEVAESERAYAFARGTWCGGEDARVTFVPQQDEMFVVFERGTRRIQGRASVLKVDDGVLLSINPDQTPAWDVQPVNADTIDIWQTWPAEPGAPRGAVNFERFVRCA